MATVKVGFSNVSPVLNELLCLTKLGVEPEKEVVLHWSLNDVNLGVLRPLDTRPFTFSVCGFC